jgi:large subunit ribosomal protein L21
MHAVIVSGGQQYRVKEGQFIKVEKIDQQLGSSIELKDVLMILGGDTQKIGTPFVQGSSVKAEIVAHGRGEKIEIIKFRRRKHSMKRQGHRQSFTQLKITQIVA